MPATTVRVFVYREINPFVLEQYGGSVVSSHFRTIKYLALSITASVLVAFAARRLPMLGRQMPFSTIILSCGILQKMHSVFSCGIAFLFEGRI